MKKSLEIFDSTSGENDVHYSSAVETLGQIQLTMGDIEKSIESFKYALELTARDYGPESLAYKALSDTVNKLSK